MAEDKRIRINVDYSELDQLREKMRSLTFELNRMGENFGGVTPDRFKAYANQVASFEGYLKPYPNPSDQRMLATPRLRKKGGAKWMTP